MTADFITISGEKFGGPSGCGILLKKQEAPLIPLFAGPHEFGHRAGTENSIGIIGLAKALEIHLEQHDELRSHLLELHKFTREYCEKHLPRCVITTPEKNFLPHVFHFLLPDGDSETFVAKCDLAGLSISAGSACSSGAVGVSKVLQNMGHDKNEARKGVRVSFGRGTTTEEVGKGLEIMRKVQVQKT